MTSQVYCTLVEPTCILCWKELENGEEYDVIRLDNTVWMPNEWYHLECLL